MEQIVVLGGGVAGCIAAAKLAATHHVILVEKQDKLGGLLKDVEFSGYRFDVGVFLFGNDHHLFRVFPGTREICPTVLHNNQVLTPDGRIDGYPFSLRNYIRANGLFSGAAILASLFLHKIYSRHRNDFREWIQYYLGSELYERSGLRRYIERLYCLPDTEIGLEFARYRLSKIEEECGLRINFIRMLKRYFLGTEGIYHYPCFVRPAGGFPLLFSEIERQLTDAGVTILYNTERLNVIKTYNGMLVCTGGNEYQCSRVVSTIPIPATAEAFGLEVIGDFPTMTLQTLCYELDGEPNFTSPTLYNFTQNEHWKRLTVFSRFYGKQYGKHYFSIESTTPEGNTAHIKELRAGFERHAIQCRIFDGKFTYLGTEETPNAYPLYRAGYAESQEAVKNRLRSIGVHLLGRQGNFAYQTSGEIAQHSAAVTGELQSR